MRRRPSRAAVACVLALSCVLLGAGRTSDTIQLAPSDTVEGYIALLLINETPFPGERGWVSESDTKAGMVSVLWVLESRLRHVPPGYRQSQIASVSCDDVIDVITAGGPKGQCDGFYRDGQGRFVAVDRVHERVEYLLRCANQGKPGRFARLLGFADGLAHAYVQGGIEEADRFAALEMIGDVPVTGRAYSWMTDLDHYNPGGNFVRIPDDDSGSLGGNRFFTLRRLK